MLSVPFSSSFCFSEATQSRPLKVPLVVVSYQKVGAARATFEPPQKHWRLPGQRGSDKRGNSRGGVLKLGLYQLEHI